MKKLLIAIVFGILVFSACKPQEVLVSNKWKLIEVLNDPGDGSGTFISVQSDRTIEFLNDGTFESNGDLCNMGTDSDQVLTGLYSEIDFTLTPDGCSITPVFPISYTMSDEELIINYPCIEPCQQKYIKVE